MKKRTEKEERKGRKRKRNEKEERKRERGIAMGDDLSYGLNTLGPLCLWQCFKGFPY